MAKKPDIVTIIFFLSLVLLIIIIPIMITDQSSVIGKGFAISSTNNECYYRMAKGSCVCLDLTNSRYRIYASPNEEQCRAACQALYSCVTIKSGLKGWISDESGKIIEVMLK